MIKMISHIRDSLENFNFEEQFKQEHYVWMNNFLTDPESRVLFFWNDFETIELRARTAGPPQFYGHGINQEDYQVAFFIKK